MQLLKLQSHFAHPSAKKLFALLKKARPEDLTPETSNSLPEISAACDACQRIQDGLGRFRVSLGGEEFRFNERLMMKIMHLEAKPVLHIVDSYAHFSDACFLSDVST